MRHPIPSKALDDRLGFIGTSGSGKTYNAGTAIETLLARQARSVIIDPLGVWWGLRLLADGKRPSNFNVVIFGGDHADLPLNEQAGALIGETAATMAESCIVDLSKMPSRSAERRFMTAFLETIYRKAGGEPFHLIVDEADLFAPQRPQAGDEVLLGHMENIVRRGRVRGFIPWLISQRPAVLNKNVLSQVDGLLAFKLTASHDRDALDAWIEGQADKAQGKAIKDALPTFQVGEGIVWLPAHGILDRKPFPQKITFDSSRKPKRGEKLKNRKLKPLNVGKLKEQLASVVEEAKANDPKELRKQVNELKAQLAKAAAAKPVPAAAPKKDQLDKIRTQAIEQAKKAYAPLRTALEAAMKFIVEINARDFFKEGGDAIDKKAVEKAISDATAHIAKLIEGHMTARERQLTAVKADAQKLVTRMETLIKKADEDVKVAVDVTHNKPFTISAPLPPSPLPRPRAIVTNGSAGSDAALTPMKQSILNSLAWMESLGQVEATKMMTAFLADSSPKSSTFEKYVSQLRSAGLITSPRPNVYALTEEGRALADAGESALTHDAIMAKIGNKLTPGQLNIVRGAVVVYPETITKSDLAVAANSSETSSTFEKYLSQVKSLGLVEQPTERVPIYRASERLFP